MGHKGSDTTEQLTHIDEKCFKSLQNSDIFQGIKLKNKFLLLLVKNKDQKKKKKKLRNFLKTQISFKVVFLINYCLLIYKSVTRWKVPGRRQSSI